MAGFSRRTAHTGWWHQRAHHPLPCNQWSPGQLHAWCRRLHGRGL